MYFPLGYGSKTKIFNVLYFDGIFLIDLVKATYFSHFILNYGTLLSKILDPQSSGSEHVNDTGSDQTSSRY